MFINSPSYLYVGNFKLVYHSRVEFPYLRSSLTLGCNLVNLFLGHCLEFVDRLFLFQGEVHGSNLHPT